MCTCLVPAISPPHTHRSPKNTPSICGHAKVRDLQSGSEPVCHFEQSHFKNWEKSKGLVGVPTKMANRKAVCNYKFCLLEGIRPCHWCSRVVVQSHVNKTPPLATEWKKPCTFLVRDQMAFFLFSFIRIPPMSDQEPDTNLVTLRNLVLTLWRGREQGFFTEGDPLWLVGSDDMVQGRHAKRMLLIFTLLTSSRPQKDVWGEQGSSTASLGLQSITDVGECSNQNRDKTGPPWLWSICQAEICFNEKGNWNR